VSALVDHFLGARIAILASGPSLTLEDAKAVKEKCVVIAVNNSVELLPEADVLYASDMRWWKNNVEVWKPFRGLRVTRQMDGPATKTEKIYKLPYHNSSGVSKNHLCLGRNSGHGALSLAYYLGASEAILLGFDMSLKDGVHWHGPHKRGPNPRPCSMLTWQNYFTQTARVCRKIGFPVYNCSRRTELEGFARKALEEVL
jgi:hypothetical protein